MKYTVADYEAQGWRLIPPTPTHAMLGALLEADCWSPAELYAAIVANSKRIANETMKGQPT